MVNAVPGAQDLPRTGEDQSEHPGLDGKVFAGARALSDLGEVGWLEALMWPEQVDRLARLRAAIKIAAEQKPRMVKGDLRTCAQTSLCSPERRARRRRT
jgi:hypothetical protein